MADYIWLGTQPLDFGDQRVEPNVDGGSAFTRDLSAAQEASYGGALVRAEAKAALKKGGKVTNGD
jgi:hypothetical protein